MIIQILPTLKPLLLNAYSFASFFVSLLEKLNVITDETKVDEKYI